MDNEVKRWDVWVNYCVTQAITVLGTKDDVLKNPFKCMYVETIDSGEPYDIDVIEVTEV